MEFARGGERKVFTWLRNKKFLSFEGFDKKCTIDKLWAIGCRYKYRGEVIFQIQVSVLDLVSKSDVALRAIVNATWDLETNSKTLTRI